MFGEYIKILLFSTFLVLGILSIIWFIPAIVLNKLNKLIYNRKTWLAWIPVANIYLLGKLTVNEKFGAILLLILFLCTSFSTSANGITLTANIFSENIRSIVLIVYILLLIGLIIYAIVKCFKLSKNNRR